MLEPRTMRTRCSIDKQRGAALLLLMLVVIIATATVLVTNLTGDALRTRQLTDTQFVMAKAKQALIEYAMLNPDVNVGRSFGLPCPDIDGTGGFVAGEAHSTSCGAAGETVIGRLPWRTLGIPALRDASAACLWYVVSGSYKDADTATAPMINPDSNGHLRLFSVDTGSVVQGLLPQDRPVALVIAAMEPVAGQARVASAAGMQCSPGSDTRQYLDTDPGTGISNAVLSGAADSVEAFATAATPVTLHNDRVIAITRAEIESRVLGRPDHEAQMRALGLAVAGCVANYATGNSGGASDRRLPWPATVTLSDYRADEAYDDSGGGTLSGRLPDVVDDSSALTGNAINRVLADCNTTQVPEWSASTQARWQNWKDHFFYAVADSHAPSATLPSNCGNCITVNGAGQFAAVVIFSHTRLDALAQVRNAPPIDTDTKANVLNYLEGNNALNVPAFGPLLDFASQPAGATFNDLLFCIDAGLVVSEC